MTDVRRILSENRRAVWLITAGLLINAALYALVVYPLAQRVSAEEGQAGAATSELVAARKAHAAATGTVTGKKEADQELQQFYTEVLPADLSAARRLLYARLDQLVRTADLDTRISRFEPDAGSPGELNKLGRTLTLTGEYANIRRFIHELERTPEFLVLESVVVTTENQEDGERQLNLTVRVATYYRTAANGN